jgi:asparagine synthase (glutamine-hydrolysing)
MGGLVGIVGGQGQEQATLLEAMVEALTFTPKRRVERTVGQSAALAVVTHGPQGDGPAVARSEDGTRFLLLFGECFDYTDAKKRLEASGCRFRHPANDAEFFLHLYEQKSIDGLVDLSGSFCAAIYDASAHELTLVSDRLGTRPLFHALTPDGRLVFATQVSSILRCADVPRDLDTAAVLEFCTLQRVLGDKTHHAAIRVLPPASVLRFDGSRIKISEYWQLRYAPQPGSADEYAEELAQVMRWSARNLHRGGGKVAMLLSGGLDARMVVAASEGPLHCYTFADYFNPEVRAAQQVAAAKGFEFTFLKRKPDHYVDLLDRSVEIGGGMYAFNHAHAIGSLDEISAKCDVVTHGYAPELMFRGTSLPRVPRQWLGLEIDEVPDPSLKHSSLGQRILSRGYSMLSQGARNLLTPSAAQQLDVVLARTSEELVARASTESDNVYDQFLAPDVYHHARYPSMLFEISLRSFMKERSLFFNNGVIDLFLRMPLALRSSSVVWLKALRRLDRKVAGAVNANTGHSALMHPALAALLDITSSRAARLPLAWRWHAARQSKADASAPASHSPISWPRFDWMIRNHDRLRTTIASTLTDPAALPPEIFDHAKLHALLENHLNGQASHRHLLFAMLTFGRWHQRYSSDTSNLSPSIQPMSPCT